MAPCDFWVHPPTGVTTNLPFPLLVFHRPGVGVGDITT
jgi:hypothetical protein